MAGRENRKCQMKIVILCNKNHNGINPDTEQKRDRKKNERRMRKTIQLEM